jgi:hypothetical protein
MCGNHEETVKGFNVTYCLILTQGIALHSMALKHMARSCWSLMQREMTQASRVKVEDAMDHACARDGGALRACSTGSDEDVAWDVAWESLWARAYLMEWVLV